MLNTISFFVFIWILFIKYDEIPAQNGENQNRKFQISIILRFFYYISVSCPSSQLRRDLHDFYDKNDQKNGTIHIDVKLNHFTVNEYESIVTLYLTFFFVSINISNLIFFLINLIVLFNRIGMIIY